MPALLTTPSSVSGSAAASASTDASSATSSVTGMISPALVVPSSATSASPSSGLRTPA
jgi:hypothetical protein